MRVSDPQGNPGPGGSPMASGAGKLPVHLQCAPGERETPDAILRRALRQRRLNYTAERQEILREALATHDHFDAHSFYQLLRRRGARISRATVFRTLHLLQDIGILREVFRGPHGTRYEHVYGHAHHEHMICLACGKVIEFDSVPLEKVQEDACRNHQFVPVRHHLQVFGYCAGCAPREKPRATQA